jgi:hypothetical protein
MRIIVPGGHNHSDWGIVEQELANIHRCKAIT